MVTRPSQSNRQKGERRQGLSLLVALSVLCLWFLIEAGLKIARQESRLSRTNASLKDVDLFQADHGAMLTDGVLSIIQSYYVDADRVSNDELLEITLKVLSQSYRLEYEKTLAGFSLLAGERSLDVELANPVSYQELVDVVTEIARFCDRNRSFLFPSNPLDGIKPKTIMSGAEIVLGSMLVGLDAHSSLLSPEAYRDLRQGTEGTFGGLGVLVGIRDQLLTVIKPMPRSPALRAGVKTNDRIIGIDGVETYGQTLDQVVEYMRGDPGSSVLLQLLRQGADGPVDVNLTREIIKVDSTTVRVVKDHQSKILHIAIDSFSSRTSTEVRQALKKARSENGGRIDGVVLDLRSNPGGLLDQAVQISDIFLGSGLIVSTKGRREEIEMATDGRDELDFPLVVLINNDSASASEIVAGALQDQGRAVVVGQPSFGKGSVQTIFELPNDRALKLTIARYYTPLGKSIQNVGIVPDVWLQPLLRNDQNLNLLGGNRYKNEAFLLNHLSGNGSPLGIEPSEPALKGYYLVEKFEDEPATEAGFWANDREFDVASVLIKKTVATYPKGIPASSRRASHWLALASRDVQDRIARMEGEVSNWLLAKHKVDWMPAPAVQKPTLSLSTSMIEPHQVRPGGEFKLHWTIENRESIAVPRVSLFVRSGAMTFDTGEVLVGTIKAGEEKSGDLVLRVPSYVHSGPLHLQIGLASGAAPIDMEGSTARLDIQEVLSPVIGTHVELKDEPSKGVEGALEPGELGRLLVTLRNNGEGRVNGIRINILNLAGKQVELETSNKTIDSMDSGESKVIEFPIRGSAKILSKNLTFGLSLEAEELLAPIRRRISVPGHTKNSDSKNLAH